MSIGPDLLFDVKTGYIPRFGPIANSLLMFFSMNRRKNVDHFEGDNRSASGRCRVPCAYHSQMWKTHVFPRNKICKC